MSSEELRPTRSCSTRKEVNMIKRLFRTWLRYKLVKHIGEPINYEQVFEWIYDSPILEWYIRIQVAHWSEHLINFHKVSEGEKVDLDEAQKYLDLIHK